MVEFSIVVVVFLVIIFAMIDLLRFFAVKAVLAKGAQQGLLEAESISGLEWDLRQVGPPNCTAATIASASATSCTTTTPPTLAQCRAYWEFKCARQKAIAAATFLPLNSFVAPAGATNTFSYLTQFQQDDELNTIGSGRTVQPNPQPFDAAVLLPGQRARDIGASTWAGANRYMCNPAMIPESASASAKCVNITPTPARIKDSDVWLDVLSRQPMLVALRAEVSPIVPWPFFPKVTSVYGIAVGYREIPRLTRIPPDLNIPIAPNTATILPPTTLNDTTPPPPY